MVGRVSGEILLEDTQQGERLVLAGRGAWIAVNANGLETAIERLIRKYPSAKNVAIDMAKVERLDTFGAWLL